MNANASFTNWVYAYWHLGAVPSVSCVGYRKHMDVKGALAVLFNQRFIKCKKAATGNWAKHRLSDAQLVRR